MVLAMSSGRSRGRTGMDAETTEAVLEQRVGALEIAPQPPRRGGAVLAGKRLRARRAKEVPVDTHQERRCNSRVAGVDSLLLERIGECLRHERHDLELLRPQRRRVLQDAREGRESRAAEAPGLADLQTAERTDDRLLVGAR